MVLGFGERKNPVVGTVAVEITGDAAIEEGTVLFHHVVDVVVIEAASGGLVGIGGGSRGHGADLVADVIAEVAEIFFAMFGIEFRFTGSV